jgi:hypothetical protein
MIMLPLLALIISFFEPQSSLYDFLKLAASARNNAVQQGKLCVQQPLPSLIADKSKGLDSNSKKENGQSSRGWHNYGEQLA